MHFEESRSATLLLISMLFFSAFVPIVGLLLGVAKEHRGVSGFWRRFALGIYWAFTLISYATTLSERSIKIRMWFECVRVIAAIIYASTIFGGFTARFRQFVTVVCGLTLVTCIVVLGIAGTTSEGAVITFFIFAILALIGIALAIGCGRLHKVDRLFGQFVAMPFFVAFLVALCGIVVSLLFMSGVYDRGDNFGELKRSDLYSVDQPTDACLCSLVDSCECNDSARIFFITAIFLTDMAMQVGFIVMIVATK